MSEDNNRGFDLQMDRRTALKTLGTTSVVAAGAGLGTFAFSERGSAQSSTAISANSPSTVANDRGDVSKVTIDPEFRVEWENFDTAVGKVFYVIEGKVGSDSDNTGYWPVFRSTPWLTSGSLSGVDQSKPGTTGYHEFTDPLSDVMEQSSEARTGDDKTEDPRSLPRAIQIANELGRPEYDNADYADINGVTADSYLAGNSVGGADEAYTYLDDGEIAKTEGSSAEFGSSDLNNNKGDLPLVNNFPGAASGYYGAVTDTERFDVGTDSTSKTTTVTLRYTFALQTVNESSVQYFTENDFGNYSGVDDAVRNDPQFENVRPSDVNSGNSVLVMNAEDGYPDITNNGAGDPAANNYDAYQTVAGNHPAVISTETSFPVTVENEAAEATATGDSNTNASGGGQ